MGNRQRKKDERGKIVVAAEIGKDES